MENSFDEKSKGWDTEERIARAEIISKEILTHVPFSKTGNVLEFGCGTGLITFNLYNSSNTFFHIDTSAGMIEVVKQKALIKNIKNVIALNADIFSSIIEQKHFDFIYTSMAVHHVIDLEDLFARVKQITYAGAYICIVDLVEEDGSFHSEYDNFNGHNGFNTNKLYSLLLQQGFQTEYCNIFFRDHKLIDEKNVEYSLLFWWPKK